MRIAVNLLPFREKLGGVGRYAKNTLSELALLDNENEYFLFLTKNSLEHFDIKKENFKQIICNVNSNSFIKRIIYEQIKLPKELNKYGIDLLFTPSVAIPIFSGQKKITTIHDIAYKKIKKKYPFLRRKYIGFVTKIALQKSDKILTVSEFSKNELLDEFKIKSEKISVIHNGVGAEYFAEYSCEKVSEIKRKYNLPDNYILYVGAIEPGKNLDILLEAFQLICEKRENINLVLTGGLGWQEDYIYHKINKKEILDKIIILPYIKDEELPIIYRNSELFVYISPYEGFGIPVLEAMASKIPVLASQSDAITEFALDSIFYVKDNNANFINKKIQYLLTNTLEVDIKINLAFERARNLTWVASAKKLYSILKQ